MAQNSSGGTSSGSKSGSSSGGNVLTQRIGPLPLWVWAVVAVGVYLVFLRKKTSGTASASSTGSVSTPPQTETITYPTGSSYSGPVGYAPTGGGGGSPGTGPSSGPGGGNSGLTGGQIVTAPGLSFHGTGYSIGNYQGGTVQGNTGSPFSTVSSYAQTLNLLNSGAAVYYQPAPGVFQQITSATQLKSLEHTQKGPQTTTYVKA